MQQKGEDDGNEIAALHRRIRELEAKIDELDEDLQNEKRLRTRVSITLSVTHRYHMCKHLHMWRHSLNNDTATCVYFEQAEKQRSDLTKELEDLKDKIEEAGGVASAQIELNKKREAELIKMQADAQVQSEEHDRSMADTRKKHQQTLNDLQEQVNIIIMYRYCVIGMHV